MRLNSTDRGLRGMHGLLSILLLIALTLGLMHSTLHAQGTMREFRGAWVATVYNLDWPSKPGLSAAAQRAELIRILDTAKDTGLNAVLFQVRSASDSVYKGREPWASCLTGRMGGDPGYDPLAFAIQEAHARGLELHAWFNPFRAVTNVKNPVSSDHISKRKPEWTIRHGNQVWLDPGNPEVRKYVIDIVMDVVRRYNIDGVHLDDYFYPYKSTAPGPFKDQSSFARHGGGKSLLEWRRQNVNALVMGLNQSIHSAKPRLLFGVSPFGIWRPGVPASIEAGVDAYNDLGCDARLWVQRGWVDYLAPQLYWSIQPAKQSFPVLLRWWASENKSRRHMWPGIATERIGKGRPASEIIRQIEICRETTGVSGHIHWNMKAIMTNRGGIRDLLKTTVYRQRAAVPPSPWLAGMPGFPSAHGYEMAFSEIQ